MLKDKLFLLSIEEVKKYLPTSESRICIFDGGRWWWLRTPGHYASRTAFVGDDGSMYCGGDYVNSTDNAVRPALHLNPAYLQSLERTKKGYIRFADKKWLVLNEETGLLLAKDAVCKHRYDEVSNVYEVSEIREFLNNKLYREMFSEEEQEMIVDTVIHGEKSYAVNSNVPETKTPHSDCSIDESPMMKMHLLFEELLTKTLAAHEKLYQYNQIGTVEEFRSAMETVKCFHTDKKVDEKMTEDEALNILCSELKHHPECSIFYEALSLAISALKEIEKMTEDEALNILCSELKHHPECSIFYEALSLAISALKEIKQYRENETIDAELDFDETEEELLRKYSKENKSE